jgi:ComF family protein
LQEGFELTIARLAVRWLSLWLAPPSCCLCGEDGRWWRSRESGRLADWQRIPLDLCEHCSAALPRPSQYWTRAWSRGGGCEQFAAFRYDDPVDRLIRQYKFHGDRASGRVLATLLGALRGSQKGRPMPEAIVPVPPHATRFRERGFDHTFLLAQWVGEVLALPVLADGLVRVRSTAPQVGLAGAARRQNVQGAFAVPAHAQRRAPIRVALLDDVLTTGSTLGAASEALRAGGLQVAEHWVLARAASPLQAPADPSGRGTPARFRQTPPAPRSCSRETP